MLKLSELTNEQLIATFDSYNAALLKRWEASAHPKFQKMPFPPPNPEFLKLFNEVKLEIEKRKLEINHVQK